MNAFVPSKCLYLENNSLVSQLLDSFWMPVLLNKLIVFQNKQVDLEMPVTVLLMLNIEINPLEIQGRKLESKPDIQIVLLLLLLLLYIIFTL